MSKTFRHALKTGLAATITWWIYGWLPLPDRTHPIWAVVSTVLVMQSNLGGVLRASGVRLLGTAIGAFVGVVAATLAGANEWSLALSIILTLTILGGVGLPESLRLAGSTAAVVIVTLQPGQGAWHVGIMRFLDVTIGASVAISVQTILWPRHAHSELADAIAGVVRTLRALYPVATTIAPTALVIESSTERDALRSELIAATSQMRELFADLQREPGDRRQEITEWNSYLRACEELEHHALAVEHAQRWLNDDPLRQHLAEPLDSLCALTMQSFDRILAGLDGTASLSLSSLHALDAAIANTDAAMTRLRDQGLTLSYPTTEVVRFCTYFFNLRAVARHVAALEAMLATRQRALTDPRIRG